MDIGFRHWFHVLGTFVFISFSSTYVLAKEVLFVHPPDGWRLNFETDIADIRFLEYFPKGESPRTWTEMITIQFIDNTRGLNPFALANNLRARFVTGCGRQIIRGPERFNMNGYLAVRLYVECDEPSIIEEPSIREFPRHEVMAFQIIQGRRNLYLIERAWRGRTRIVPNSPYGRDDVWGWDGFWHNIEVCDSEDRARACFGFGLLSPEEVTIFMSQEDPALPYGCDYFRVLSILPNTAQAIQPTLVVPLKLDSGSFGRTNREQNLISHLVSAYVANIPVAVIVSMAGRALSNIFSTDAAKARRDTNTIVSLLVASGVTPDRVHQALNADCPGG
ncbi:MAG: hypothetical protein CMF67_12650 [Magnetovibrio sp.]|nr:hypothetical protein [Magnetovibrio sp.]|tara:strand:- start:665 stop:1666 length:1002 start_codon:yes stop_codon:yes gene_type:complete